MWVLNLWAWVFGSYTAEGLEFSFGISGSASWGLLEESPKTKRGKQRHLRATWQQVQSLRPLVALPQLAQVRLCRLAFQGLGLVLLSSTVSFFLPLEKGRGSASYGNISGTYQAMP